MALLVLPPRFTQDTIALRRAAIAAGWEVERLACWCSAQRGLGHPMSKRTSLRRLGRRVLGAAVVAALAYPVSLGPACWAMAWLRLEMNPAVADGVFWLYSPLAPATVYGPEPVRRGLRGWIRAGLPPWAEFQDWPNGVGWSSPGYTYTLWNY